MFTEIIGIGSELLKNVIYGQMPEYEWFGIVVITGMFTSKTSQQIAESTGMETLYTFMYTGWTIDNEETHETKTFFRLLKPDDHSISVMAMQIRAVDKSPQSTIANTENE